MDAEIYNELMEDNFMWTDIKGSSQVKQTRYDDEQECLFIRFNNNAVYRYDNVDRDLYDRFLASESKGKFLNAEIKGKFKTTKL